MTITRIDSHEAAPDANWDARSDAGHGVLPNPDRQRRRSPTALLHLYRLPAMLYTKTAKSIAKDPKDVSDEIRDRLATQDKDICQIWYPKRSIKK